MKILPNIRYDNVYFKSSGLNIVFKITYRDKKYYIGCGSLIHDGSALTSLGYIMEKFKKGEWVRLTKQEYENITE